MLIGAVRFPYIFEKITPITPRCLSRRTAVWRRNETLLAALSAALARSARAIITLYGYRVHLPPANDATSSNPGERLTNRAQPTAEPRLFNVFAFCI